MTPSIHPTWKALYGDISIDEYQAQMLPKIYFTSNVHEDIQKTFSVIDKLLLHGYFEYEFLDVAVTKSLQAFEMALKLRYEQITLKKWNKHSTLDQLLNYFHSRNYFEFVNPTFIEHIRKSRNALTHPERHGFGGYSGLHWIDTTVDLINDIYEDLPLRLQRFETRKIISKQLAEIVKNGATVKSSEFAGIIFLLDLVFINNKNMPPVYTFVGSLIFSDPDSNTDPISLELPENFFSLTNSQLVCFPGTPFEIKFESISSDTELQEFRDWENNKIKGPFVANQMFNSHRIDEIFVAARKKFHAQINSSQS